MSEGWQTDPSLIVVVLLDIETLIFQVHDDSLPHMHTKSVNIHVVERVLFLKFLIWIELIIVFDDKHIVPFGLVIMELIS